MREQGFEVAISIDQLGCGLDADARHARHVVGAVATQRLHLDDLVRADAELLAHFRLADRAITHRVAHLYVVPDELHQILVGRQDGHLRAGFDSMACIGRDKVVGLEVLQFDLANIERRRRAPHMRQLRAKIVRHFPPVCFVCVVNAIAETAPRRIENDRHVIGVSFAPIFIQHIAE